MQGVNSLIINPVVKLLTQYKEMSKNDIIGHLADWFNVDAEQTFKKNVDDGIITENKKTETWKLIDHTIQEGIENLFGPPASQAFADTGNNPHIDQTKLGKPFDEKSDTGDDQTRTGPGGLLPRDNYDSIHYQGKKDSKIHLATPYHDGKEIHDVSGTIPELQEDIKITIEDPLGDENIHTIELIIKEPELELRKLEEEPQSELKDYHVRKDPDTHTSTIKAGEQSIEDTIPISDIWKEEHGLAEAPASSIDFIKKMFPQLFTSGIIAMSLVELLDLLKGQNYEQMDLFRGKEIEDMQKLSPVKFLKFKYNSGKIECPICKPLDGMEFAEDDTTRPILPSEKMGEGVYNTHPNCLCTYEGFSKLIEEEKTPKSDSAQSRAAASSLRERHDITEEYLRPLKESLNIYKDRMPGEFDWVNDEAIENMKTFTKEHPDGRFILAVVSGESFTDHRIEGETLRRHWTKNELIQNIRTAKHKLTDINHMWQKKDPMSGMIYDANWNFTTDRGEMILWESDPDILNAIRNDIITAVSINTGKPREVEENCSTGECFTEASGTVLGEDNNVALAYIVTDPQGFKYNGQVIPAMPPGMKFTKLYLIE